MFPPPLLLLIKRTAPFKAEGAGIESSRRGLTLDAYLKGDTSLLLPGREETDRAMGEKSRVSQGDFTTELQTQNEWGRVKRIGNQREGDHRMA